MTRGVLYLHWQGVRPHAASALERSIASVKEFHPELPIHVKELPAGSNMLDKADMVEHSPFDETLYLDTDTVVLGRLDHGFEKAAQHGVACSICECPWARRVVSMREMGDVVEFNCGVLFWSRKGEPLMRRYQQLTHEMDTTILFWHEQVGLAQLNDNDQAGFAMAVEQLGFNPWVLPLNWNFRPKWHRACYGPIKIWHDYAPVPEWVRTMCREQSHDDAILELHEVSTGPGACGTPTPSPASTYALCESNT